MKKFVSILMLCAMALGVKAQEGVKFMEGSFQEALEVAKAQKKMLFVDVYTSWCGPCRWMSEKVLQTPEAAAFFDKHVVCLKIDAEKGEGVEFADRYDAHAYPTFLMFTADGTLRHKIVGADTLHLFIPRMENGLHEKTSWAYFMDKYQNGTLAKKEIPQALQVFRDAAMKEETRHLADSLFALLDEKERLDSRYWNMYAFVDYLDLFSERFRFLVTHRTAIAQGEHDSETLKIIRTHLSDHLLNNTTGRITREENPWYCGEANEMPRMKTLIEASDLPEKAFFLAWCDLAQACYDLDSTTVKEQMMRIATFPESKIYQHSFLPTFERFCPDAQDELKQLQAQWE